MNLNKDLLRSSLQCVLLIALPSLFAHWVDAEEPDFSRDVLPILSDKCFVCHGPDADQSDNLRLDSFESATQDLGDYRAVNPEAPLESELLKRITSDDDPMPPNDAEKQLSDAEVEVLRSWILAGGKYAQHWAFEKPRKRVPSGASEFRNTIDAFIARKHAAQGVSFADPADRATLARRVALVLCGLPPEPSELAFFLQDTRADAFERFVDGQIEKPQFGEHQARYWLDAVRYGDTHGLHLDSRRGVFPYRDWVVRAINQNLPFDDFVTWQLAGDLLRNPSLEQLVATGFVRMNPTSGEGGAIAEEYQAKNNFDRTENLGTVLLGMSLTCARCHTHKYDPIEQSEYYRLMAFFNSTAEPPLDRNKYDYGPHIDAPSDQQQWDRWRRLDQERTTLLESVAAKFEGESETITEEIAQKWAAATAEEKLQMLAAPRGDFVTWEVHADAARWQSQWEELKSGFTSTLIAKELPKPRATRLLNRGEYHSPVGPNLEPGVPQVMGEFDGKFPKNRLGLAQWLTAPEHPLVARVIVNRTWQQIFGDGLVRTPEDFGLQGEQPTHPDLLDWLAVDFQENGWDFKRLVKQMVTSQTFCQQSAWRSDFDDPENRLWARGPSYRLDAEIIRDIGLWASGLLDSHMGGEGVKPYQPAGMWKALAHPASNTKHYERDKGARLYRRSLYVYVKRTSPHPMMLLFDAPDREASCVRRSRSSTALQSLALLNETQRVEMARKLAERVILAANDDAGRFAFLFQTLGCRDPSPRELTALAKLLGAMEYRYQQATDDALKLLSSGDAARNEDIDANLLAAWTHVCLTVLASDLALILY